MSGDREKALGYCLVTGGSGFLGRHLVAELLRRGERVRAFDRVAPDLAHRNLDVVLGDLRDFAAVCRACEGIDTVFHTAAVLCLLSSPTPQERETSHEINGVGVRNVIRACREAGVKRLVHTHTSQVAFDGPVIDGDESLPHATHARDPYTRTRILGEQAVRVDRPAWYWWVLIPAGMGLTGLLALGGAAHAWWSAHVTPWTPRWLIGGIFAWACLLHVYKGLRAVRMAERAGLHETSLGWGWQTFMLGFASLGLLERRIERARAASRAPVRNAD